MGRYETPFQLELTRDQLGHLANNGRAKDARQLYVAVQGETLTAVWPASDTFDNPPTFHGSIKREPNATVVTGIVREAFANMAWARVWPFPMFLMLAVAVLGVVDLTVGGDRSSGLGPLIFGAIGATVFALMWWWQTSLRKPSFDRDARKLTDGLRDYLTTGDGRRPF